MEQVKAIAAKLQAKPGDLMIMVAGDNALVSMVLGRMRQEMGIKLGLVDSGLFAFAFINDFPLLQWNMDLNRWEAVHHPFTSPVEEDIPLLDTDPGAVRSRAYDIVLNGYEIGGGSIRIHQSWLQRKIFQIMNYTDDEINDRFGHLLEAFSYGAPPHGGIAVGIDRTVMLFAGESTIREVIAFPKNQNAVDLLFDAPATVREEQLNELHIKTTVEE